MYSEKVKEQLETFMKDKLKNLELLKYANKCVGKFDSILNSKFDIELNSIFDSELDSELDKLPNNQESLMKIIEFIISKVMSENELKEYVSNIRKKFEDLKIRFIKSYFKIYKFDLHIEAQTILYYIVRFSKNLADIKNPICRKKFIDIINQFIQVEQNAMSVMDKSILEFPDIKNAYKKTCTYNFLCLLSIHRLYEFFQKNKNKVNFFIHFLWTPEIENDQILKAIINHIEPLVNITKLDDSLLILHNNKEKQEQLAKIDNTITIDEKNVIMQIINIAAPKAKGDTLYNKSNEVLLQLRELYPIWKGLSNTIETIKTLYKELGSVHEKIDQYFVAFQIYKYILLPIPSVLKTKTNIKMLVIIDTISDIDQYIYRETKKLSNKFTKNNEIKAGEIGELKTFKKTNEIPTCVIDEDVDNLILLINHLLTNIEGLTESIDENKVVLKQNKSLSNKDVMDINNEFEFIISNPLIALIDLNLIK